MKRNYSNNNTNSNNKSGAAHCSNQLYLFVFGLKKIKCIYRD